MVLLSIESWTSQWDHLVRGVGYHDDSVLTSWASFHYISTSVVYSVLEWEQSSGDYLLSHVIYLWNWLMSLFYTSHNHWNWNNNFTVTRVWTCELALEISTTWLIDKLIISATTAGPVTFSFSLEFHYFEKWES